MDSENSPASQPDKEQESLRTKHSRWMEISFVSSAIAIFSDFLGLIAAKRTASKGIAGFVLVNVAAWGTAIFAQYKAHAIDKIEREKERQEIREETRAIVKEEVSGHAAPELSNNKWQQDISKEQSVAKSQPTRTS